MILCESSLRETGAHPIQIKKSRGRRALRQGGEGFEPLEKDSEIRARIAAADFSVFRGTLSNRRRTVHYRGCAYYGQLSNVQSGKMGPSPGSPEL